MFVKEERAGFILIYARCVLNNVVRFHGSLMVAAGALITTKYSPISPPGTAGVESVRDFQPSYCRRGTQQYASRSPFFHQPTHPFCRISTSWTPPWRWPLDLGIEGETRFPSTRISDKFFIARCLWREDISFFIHFWIYTVCEMRQSKGWRKRISSAKLIDPS